jgi:hypothetical protein
MAAAGTHIEENVMTATHPSSRAALSAEEARKDELFRARLARQSEAASHIQHGDPRCLTEEMDGECVCS